MGCKNCTEAIKINKGEDEKILELAREKAKSSGISVGLFRDELGRLCIATGNDPVQQIITPLM